MDCQFGAGAVSYFGLGYSWCNLYRFTGRGWYLNRLSRQFNTSSWYLNNRFAGRFKMSPWYLNNRLDSRFKMSPWYLNNRLDSRFNTGHWYLNSRFNTSHWYLNNWLASPLTDSQTLTSIGSR